MATRKKKRLYDEEYNDKPVAKKSIKRRSASAYCEDEYEELIVRGYRTGRDAADLFFDVVKLLQGR